MLKIVGLENAVNKQLRYFSSGMKQRLKLAQAFFSNTPILLLDEPTAHLDLNNRVEIMKLLLSLARKKNKAIVVATHELDLALQMADTIWLATPDRKIKTGIPEDLVLDGSFDEIFQFKGFDLKTGKVQHQSFRNSTIHLQGSGYEFLWTKNALGREGFSVLDEGSLLVKVADKKWEVKNKHFTNLKELIDFLILPDVD